MSDLSNPEPWDIAIETLGSEQVGWDDTSAIVIRTPAELAEMLEAIAARRAVPAQASAPEVGELVSVPRQPTPAMNDAYNDIVMSGIAGSPAHSSHVWAAMLDAAPVLAQGEPEATDKPAQ